jgi:hypothetical protein
VRYGVPREETCSGGDDLRASDVSAGALLLRAEAVAGPAVRSSALRSFEMGLVGQGSNQDPARRLDRLTDCISRLDQAFAKAEPLVASRPQRKRRQWGEVAGTIVAVLASGELRARDIHVAVEALLDESVSKSSVKNCRTERVVGDRPLLDRIGRGRYRLRS